MIQIKTFYGKLEDMDKQVNDWLSDNKDKIEESSVKISHSTMGPYNEVLVIVLTYKLVSSQV